MQFLAICSDAIFNLHYLPAQQLRDNLCRLSPICEKYSVQNNYFLNAADCIFSLFALLQLLFGTEFVY